MKVKLNILKLEDKTVHFKDDTSEEFDHIIFATGYEVSFPFFDQDFLNVQNNEINLYEYVVHPEYEGLFL